MAHLPFFFFFFKFFVLTSSSWIFQFSVDVSLYGFTTFLPAIITGLGFQSVKANLMTVPVYFWGLITFLFTAYMSDRTGNRGYWIGGPLLFLIVGYALLISVESVAVRYFACFSELCPILLDHERVRVTTTN